METAEYLRLIEISLQLQAKAEQMLRAIHKENGKELNADLRQAAAELLFRARSIQSDLRGGA